MQPEQVRYQQHYCEMEAYQTVVRVPVYTQGAHAVACAPVAHGH
jgi:hypothetical protein